MYVIMFAMIVAILNTLTSFYGSYVESTGWLTTSIIFYWIAMVFEVIGQSVLMILPLQIKRMAEPENPTKPITLLEPQNCRLTNFM